MGQYYFACILDSAGKNVILCLSPHDYAQGAKIMNHAYLDNYFMQVVEYALSPTSKYYMSRIVWAGDYADPEPGTVENLYAMNNGNSEPLDPSDAEYRYIINHSKNLYIDKNKITDLNKIHPLPILVSEGNGRGGGDYYRNNSKLSGSWARDIISVDNKTPPEFVELICDFYF
jgi:hypothetical protein